MFTVRSARSSINVDGIIRVAFSSGSLQSFKYILELGNHASVPLQRIDRQLGHSDQMKQFRALSHSLSNGVSGNGPVPGKYVEAFGKVHACKPKWQIAWLVRLKAPRLDFYLREDVDDENLFMSLDMIDCFSSWGGERARCYLEWCKLNYFLPWIVTVVRPSEWELGSLQSLVLRNCHRLGPFQTSCYCRAELN